MRNYSNIEDVINDASCVVKWIAIDRSGEIWGGDCEPQYHEYLPLWVWLNCEPMKIGWAAWMPEEWRYTKTNVETLCNG